MGLACSEGIFQEMVGKGRLHWALDDSRVGYDFQNYAADVQSQKKVTIYIYSRVFLVYDFIDLLGLGCRKSHWIFPSFSLQPIQILFNQGTRFACAHRTSSPLFLPSPLSYGSLTDSFISLQNNKITTFQLPMSSSFNLTSLQPLPQLIHTYASVGFIDLVKFKSKSFR